MTTEDSTYLDYESFLDPTFSPTAFANTLVLATNNASDTPLDLTTPLSRVLFDVQEVDTHLDTLTSSSALPLLSYTKDNVGAADHVLRELETQLATLKGSYERLEREVLVRWEMAEGARIASERVLGTVRLGRVVGRCMTLGRQLEAQMTGFTGFRSGGAISAGDNKEDYRVMVRGANTILSLRQVFATAHAGGDGEGLEKINVVRSLRTELVDPAEKSIISRAEQIISQFSMSSLTAQTTNTITTDPPLPSTNSTSSSSAASAALATRAGTTYAQTENTRSRATLALMALYLLSPVTSASSYSTPATPTSKPSQTSSSSAPTFDASHLVSALQEYLRRSITSSLAGLTGALAALPKLDRTLLEVSARCQNIVALEMLLESIKPPAHLLLSDLDPANPSLSPSSSSSSPSSTTPPPQPPQNLLQPVLHSLDTPSLPSYFWRSMASQLSSRVQKILKDGGVSARTLRSNRDRVGGMIRECVNRGSQMPANVLARGKVSGASGSGVGVVGNWEREAAVMVGCVVNVIGR